MTHRSLPESDQLLAINQAINSCPTYVESLAAWAGTLSGAEHDDAIKETVGVILQMEEVDFAQYQTKLAKSLKIQLSELKRIVKAQRDDSKKKDQEGEDVEFILSGYINGWVVEYAYDPESKTAILCWRDPNGSIGSGDRLIIDGKKYLPMPPSAAIIGGNVLMPSHLGGHKGTKELSAIIESFIRSSYLLDNPIDGKFMSYYVMLSWIYDAFEAVPYLRATGEPGSGKSELMRRVGLVCYRFIAANGASSTSSLFRMIEKYQGTVFLSEMDLKNSDSSADQIKLINLGSMKGNPIIRCEEVIVDGHKEIQEKMFQTYCPKLIDMQREFYDPAVKTRCITFKLQPKETYELVRAGISLQMTADMKNRARAIRNLLLRWRLEHWQPSIEIKPDYYELDVSARLNQVTGALMMIAEDDPELQKEIRQYLREYNREIIQEKSMTIAARAVEALWTIYKNPHYHTDMMVKDPDGREKVLVGNVTKITNLIIHDMNMDDDGSEEEDSGKKKKKDELSPQKMGHRLREDLQLKMSDRTNKGFYVFWDTDHMVALAKRYGIDPEELVETSKKLEAKKPAAAEPEEASQPEILDVETEE